MGFGLGYFHFALPFALLLALPTRSIPNGNADCDLYNGRWVYDETYPMYDARTCPFVRREFDCQKYGRPDNMYLKYRWQPNGCDLPRFDGRNFMRRWIRKKILFVGDSLTLNQYESFLCMLHAAVPYARFNFTKTDTLTTVRFQDYKLTVTYYLSHYLVDIVGQKIGRVLELDSMQSGRFWLDAHLLIFNTYHWWSTRGASQPWDYVQDGDQIMKDMNRTLAMSKALVTWANWVDLNVNPAITKVFFQGLSPSHYHGENWGESPQRTCSGQTKPLDGSRYPAGPLPEQAVVKNVLSSMSKPVSLLDITLLSQLRIDAHPSKYNGVKFPNDCSHWCLPGLPDTWNQLLYASLI
ncbi:protein trichome birefringence-like 38 [Asparagus officinalis]|uniref:protein trichome birefringence-like 38 n=1 Tax=Asparagus officinalis TaxID=4686 RepID=UPI00098E6E8E|nr:protein trichome birefringence-like 38 [Asparagus officinalis]